jgi:hypothetical protein
MLDARELYRQENGPEAVRIFVSSTFIDMQVERDILARNVFPRIREKLAREGRSLFEVDLRWGITEAQSQNLGTIDICLDEIDDFMPYFYACSASDTDGAHQTFTVIRGVSIRFCDREQNYQALRISKSDMR